MLTEKTKKALLLSIFILAFTYRFMLMAAQVFPPGSDIGLHESVIKTITSGQTNFLTNQYHMGGGTSATNPGYHIFASFIIALTGMPDYLAQSLIACIFSTLIVFCVFLFVRQFWNEKAAFVAAFLGVFCGGDIAMLCWGGYPNIIALMLIPLIFVFIIQKTRFSTAPFLAVTSLLVGSLFLTHIFSALIFTSIVLFTVLVNAFLSKKTQISKKQTLLWLTPIVIGALLVSPYLFNAIPVYFSSGGNITGASLETTQALLETRAVTISVSILSIILGFSFFALSKFYIKKFVTIQAILCAAWIIVPIVLTQSYLFGVYIDYERFLYFLYFPLLVCTTLLVVKIAQKFSQLSLPNISESKNIISYPTKNYGRVLFSWLIIGLLFALLFYSPLLSAPNEAFEEASYYQKMSPLKYDAIQWIKDNTPEDTVFVADADYGWWISGFAQRPTLSAINPQFLILARELEPARVAKNLLTTDYFIDNGVLKMNYNVIDNKTSSHELYARLSGSFVFHPFFSVRDENISLLYRNHGKPGHLWLNQLPLTSLEVCTEQAWASFVTIRENELVRFTVTLTVQQGTSSAKIAFNLESKTGDFLFDWLYIPFIANGALTQYDNKLVFKDASVQSLTSVSFVKGQFGSTVKMKETSEFYELIINCQGKSISELEFAAEFLTKSDVFIQALTFFDYKKAIEEWNISYVVVADEVTFDRFAGHHSFELVYKNAEVAIFKVQI